MDIASLSQRDREILRDEVAEKIEELRYMTEMGLPWRETFEKQVSYWRGVANGRPESSEERRDANANALAHAFLLYEKE